MATTNKSTIGISVRKEQLVTLNQNLNILLEREAKYGGNPPLELLNQIDDHRQAIVLIEQALTGELTDEELNEALKPLLLALRDGHVINITAETYVAGDLIQNITHILTAAEEVAQAQEFATRRLAEGVRDFLHRLQNIITVEPETNSSPYRGLLAYRLSDAELFFGRDRAIGELLVHLQRSPLTILHAESGAGKSSLLQAGIANRLLGQGHLPVYLRPYDQSPTLAIKRVFLPNLLDTPELAEAPLRDFLRRVTSVLGSEATLYLMLDQFEEVFTLLDDVVRTEFVTELADCLEDDILPVRWVLALRTEFFGNLANFRPRIRNPFENDYRLNRLISAEAEMVIIEPATRQGIGFEPELVETLLADLRDRDSGELSPPQIQLVCSALYNVLLERQIATPDLLSTITCHMYDEEGRAEGILRSHLNRVLRRTLNPQEREVARQLLIALVSSDQRRIRRTRSDLATTLATYLTAATSLDGLLDQLVESRLLNVEEDEQTGEHSYELAHDYLLTDLEIDEATQARKAAQELLMQEVKNFRQNKNVRIPADRLGIIEAQKENLTILDADKSDAETLLRLSQDKLKRDRQKFVAGIGAVTIMVILAIISTFIAVGANRLASQAQADLGTATAQMGEVKSQQATAEAGIIKANQEIEELDRVAAALELATQSLNSNDPEQALFLAIQAAIITQKANEEAPSQTKRALRTALFNPLRKVLEWQTPEGFDRVAFSPDGKYFATASSDNTIRIWEVETGQELHLLGGHSLPISYIGFSADSRFLVTNAVSSELGVVKSSSIRVWGVEDGQELYEIEGGIGGNDGVNSSFNDQYLATVSNGNIVRIWDITTGQQLNVLDGHADEIYRLRISPNGQYLTTNGNDWTVRIWDVITGQVLRELEHNGPINSIVFSPDSQFLATGTYDDGSVHLWDVNTGKELFLFEGLEEQATARFSPNGQYLATRDDSEGIIHILDAKTGKELQVLKDRTHLEIDFSPDSKYLAAPSEDNTARVWNIETGQMEQVLNHSSTVIDVKFTPDGQYVLTRSGPEKALRIWDLKKEPERNILQKHTGPVYRVSFSPDSKYFVTTSLDKTTRIWNLEKGEELLQLKGHSDVVTSIRFDPSSQYLATGSFDTTARLWKVETGQVMHTLEGHTDSVIDVDFSPNGKYLATGSWDGTVRIWNVETGIQLYLLEGHFAPVVVVRFSPDGRYLVTGGADNMARIWDVETGDQLYVLKGHSVSVDHISFTPDGQYLATIGGGYGGDNSPGDNTAFIWEVESGKQIRTLKTSYGEFTDISFSPDGRYLEAGDNVGTLRIWDMETDQKIYTIDVPRIDTSDFSPDGEYLVTGGFQDGSVYVWEMETGQEERVLASHSGSIYDISFSPDGQYLATASEDGTARIWHFGDVDEMAEIAKRRIRQSLLEQLEKN